MGYRYGYVLGTIPKDIREKYPWLPNTDSVKNDKSVTELEVLHGALNNPSAATRSYFFFKESPPKPEGFNFLIQTNSNSKQIIF